MTTHRKNVRVDNTGDKSQLQNSDVTDLGNDVFMIDTRMGGYQGITASYLIRGSKPCLIETGTARSAPPRCQFARRPPAPRRWRGVLRHSAAREVILAK